MTQDASFRFTHALTRRPADSATGGLRAIDTGAPDIALMRAQHAAYVAALRKTGTQVIELDPLPAFPDAQFVEDTALCLPQGAILMRPGAPSRAGEVAEIAPHLRALYGEVHAIEAGHVEAGDILVTGSEVLAGLSARTDATGLSALRALLDRWGYRLRSLATPPGVLHFKTDCALLDAETILATPRLADSGCFQGYRLILTAPGEEAAANVIRVNDAVLMPAGFPGTADRLARAGFTVTELDNSECARLDGGMSCLSLRFSPGG
ncbi:MAG: hypothetical protein RIT14_536 [Pseudomonadota bacterium]|jgi:dimethylargininase